MWWTRLRWRLRGATMWPAFVLALVVDTVLLRVLPIAGDTAPDLFAAVLLGVLLQPRGRRGRRAAGRAARAPAPAGAAEGRRRRPRRDGADRAASPSCCSSVGLVAPPGDARRRARAFDAAGRGRARRSSSTSAPVRFRAHVDRMDTWKQGPRLYRTCVPGPDARRSFCVFVDTGHDPPRGHARPRPEPELACSRGRTTRGGRCGEARTHRQSVARRAPGASATDRGRGRRVGGLRRARGAGESLARLDCLVAAVPTRQPAWRSPSAAACGSALAARRSSPRSRVDDGRRRGARVGRGARRPARAPPRAPAPAHRARGRRADVASARAARRGRARSRRPRAGGRAVAPARRRATPRPARRRRPAARPRRARAVAPPGRPIRARGRIARARRRTAPRPRRRAGAAARGPSRRDAGGRPPPPGRRRPLAGRAAGRRACPAR